MKKIMKILAIIGGSLCLLFILALRQLESSVANKVNETVNHWQADSDEAPAFAVFLNKQEENSLPAPIELKTVKPGGCLLRCTSFQWLSAPPPHHRLHRPRDSQTDSGR